MSITQALISYGFSEKESLIYESLLRKMESSAFEIAKETGIPRTSVYAILDSFCKRGVASSFKKNGVAWYTPESPNKLIQSLKEKERAIQSVMPEIRALIEKSGANPIVKLYIGVDGVKTAFEDILEEGLKNPAMHISAFCHSNILDFFPRYFPNWQERRQAQNPGQSRLIVPENIKDVLPDSWKTSKHRETRILPSGFPFELTVEMYGDKIACIALKDGEFQTVIIESQVIVEGFLQFFNFIWQMLPSGK